MSDKQPLGITEWHTVENVTALLDRIRTIADEAFGPFPVQTVDESLAAIERGIFEMRQLVEERMRVGLRALADLATARARIVELDGIATIAREERDQLQRHVATTRASLQQIAEYETNWAWGPAQNVAHLQEIAERALSSLSTTQAPPKAGKVCEPWCGFPCVPMVAEECTIYNGAAWCSYACSVAGRPLNPAPHPTGTP